MPGAVCAVGAARRHVIAWLLAAPGLTERVQNDIQELAAKKKVKNAKSTTWSRLCERRSAGFRITDRVEVPAQACTRYRDDSDSGAVEDVAQEKSSRGIAACRRSCARFYTWLTERRQPPQEISVVERPTGKTTIGLTRRGRELRRRRSVAPTIRLRDSPLEASRGDSERGNRGIAGGIGAANRASRDRRLGTRYRRIMDCPIEP